MISNLRAGGPFQFGKLMTVSNMGGFRICFLGVLLCCWAAIGEATGYMKYKDSKQPLMVRVKDLTSRMTLEEKIGQMTQIERSVASAEIMKKYFIGEKIHIYTFLSSSFILFHVDACTELGY